MSNEQNSYEYERFSQEFRNRPQRRRLGVDIEQDAARRIFNDDEALRREYAAWRTRTGQALLAPAVISAPPGRLNRMITRFLKR